MFVALANVNGLPLLADPDSHWHITVGNWILEHGAVPTVDPYSYTFTGQPWIAKEWGSQVLMALAYERRRLGRRGGARRGGVRRHLGAAAAPAAAATCGRLPALMFTAAAFVMMASHFLARPFALAFPFMLLWVAGLIRAVEERRAPKPMLLLAMLFWANLHGGFTMGLLLGRRVRARGAGRRRATAAERKKMFIAWAKFGVAALLVACITPYGPARSW